ncbi:DUF5343 domain-containing protein [Pseudomonas sp. SWRI179]|uniref:DUF5343 domain-containing protein n=1 Tax=Pseudomonas sp. SWRI179 TaxID=2745497 RepID=UPI0016441811|nr:DUF5343 domain-containing protein [Pseudomonas sp. SWRI179]MBC3387331.1 DUF5343 domain-containing protein [Pseudomonas sp. SWRI179]
MADKHPYSGIAGLAQTIAQLRKSFPVQFGSDTMKKLGIAPNNESYVLNTLRFLGVLDEDGKKGQKVGSVFSQHEDDEFQRGFSEIVSSAYSELFELHGEDAWTLPLTKLIAYFRHTDNTSDIVGKKQAATFQALGLLSGKVDGAVRSSTSKPKTGDTSAPTRTARSKPTKVTPQLPKVEVPLPIQSAAPIVQPSTMALTVRVEINLPAGGDQETYDRIFKSIRENLLNGNVS